MKSNIFKDMAVLQSNSLSRKKESLKKPLPEAFPAAFCPCNFFT